MVGSEVGGECCVFSDMPWCRMWNERVVLQNKRETWTTRTRYGLTREGGITGRFRADPSLGGECQCDTSPANEPFGFFTAIHRQSQAQIPAETAFHFTMDITAKDRKRRKEERSGGGSEETPDLNQTLTSARCV